MMVLDSLLDAWRVLRVTLEKQKLGFKLLDILKAWRARSPGCNEWAFVKLKMTANQKLVRASPRHQMPFPYQDGRLEFASHKRPESRG